MPGNEMVPVVVHAALDEHGRSGRIEFTRAGRSSIVVVSRRALLSVASPPRATEERLLSYASVFCDIAIARSRIAEVKQDYFFRHGERCQDLVERLAACRTTRSVRHASSAPGETTPSLVASSGVERLRLRHHWNFSGLHQTWRPLRSLLSSIRRSSSTRACLRQIRFKCRTIKREGYQEKLISA